MIEGLVPGREHALLQIDPAELGPLAHTLATKKKVSLQDDNGITVNVSAITQKNALGANLSFSFPQNSSDLSKLATQLIELFRTFGCKTVLQLIEDPSKKSTIYSFSRDMQELKPREFGLSHYNGKVMASLSLRYKVEDLTERVERSEVLTDLFHVLSKDLAAIAPILNPIIGFTNPSIFRSNNNLDAATFPENEASLELPATTLADLVGQDHVVARLRSGFEQIDRRFRSKEMPDDIPPALKAKLAVLNGLMKLPEGYIFTGPAGVGKNFAVEGFVGELREMLKLHKPEATLLFESISPTSIRSKWWGGDEANVKDLFTRLRKGVEESGVAVLFVDEADTLLADAGSSGHQSGITNQFKIELNSKDGIIVILNSNHPERIDVNVIDRIGGLNELEFNYLNGLDVVQIVQNEFRRYRGIFSPASVDINYELLREDRDIYLRKDLSGRQVQQSLAALFGKLAQQEIELGLGSPAREIPDFLLVDTKYIKSLIGQLISH